MPIRAIIAGVVAGVVGAVVWTLISYFANAELGIIAWGVGAFVGVIVAVACQGKTDSATGCIAAVIAILAILGGKWGGAHLMANKFHAEFTRTTLASIDNDQAQLHIAAELVEEYAGNEKTLNWPNGKDADSAEALSDYPTVIQTDVAARWKSMSDEEHETFKADIRASVTATIDSFRSGMDSRAFKASFSPYDVLWFILALLSAFRIGSGTFGSDD